MLHSRRTALALTLAPLALLAACGEGREVQDVATVDSANAAPPAGASTTKVAQSSDDSWINLSGTVVSTLPSSFVLDYGPDTVTVEMDDWDWYREGRALAPGDPVVVTGRVDQDLWENKKIEASSVYAKNLNTYFYASGADEEDLSFSNVYVTSVPAYADSTGFVTAMEGEEFSLGSANGAIRVDTSKLPAASRPQVQVGDRVYVWGDLDIDAREKIELMAKGVVELSRDRTKTS